MNPKSLQKIDIFIGGAEKAGTTSLGYYLSQHPKIHSHLHMNSNKTNIIEFSLFQQSIKYITKNFSKEFDNAFGVIPHSTEYILAKNVGLLHKPQTVENLHAFFPDCKIIIVLRNPIERAYSSYWYQKYRGFETANSFEKAIDNEINANENNGLPIDLQYIRKSMYVSQIKNILKYYSKEAVKIILFEDLKNSPGKTCDEIFSFLGVEQHSVDNLKVQNKSKTVKSRFVAKLLGKSNPIKAIASFFVPQKYKMKVLQKLRDANSVEMKKPPISKDTLEKLKSVFKEDVSNLSELIDKDLSHWGIN